MHPPNRHFWLFGLDVVHEANLAGLATLGSISVPSVQSVRSVHQCGQCTHFSRKTETFGGTREKKVHFPNAAEKRQKKALALASHQSCPSPVHMPTWDSNLHWQPMVKFGKKCRSWARTGDLRDLTPCYVFPIASSLGMPKAKSLTRPKHLNGGTKG